MSVRAGVVLFFLAGAAVVGCDERADVVMSPNGPVDTLQKAVLAARQVRTNGTVTGRAVRVAVCPGCYRVAETVTLGPEDSGLHLTGLGADSTVFDAGIVLPAFRVVREGLWETTVPGGMRFDQLWIGDRLAQRARTPNEGYLYMRAPDDENEKAGFYADPADVAALDGLSKDDLGRVVVNVWQSWDNGLMPLRAFSPRDGRVTLAGRLPWPLFFWRKRLPRYALENYRAALDAPGEWYHDVAGGRVLYIPRQGERVESTRAHVPCVDCILRMDGDREKGRVVRDIRISGIGFEHVGATMDASGWRNGQSAVTTRRAAVMATGAEGVRIGNCRISHVGGHGIWLALGCRDCSIRHSLIENLGGGGVYLGDTRWNRSCLDVNAERLEVSDSILRQGGRIFNGANGVWIGHARGCSVVHNEISDFFYSGVCFGWTWGYAPVWNRENRICFNHIHHIGQGVLGDMGGVYSLGGNDGSAVCNNWIHDVNGYRWDAAPAWGLYTDEGSSHILLASNLVERCRDGAIHQHYGIGNVYANNILSGFDRFGIWRSRAEEHMTIAVSNNVFLWDSPAAGVLTGGGGFAGLKDMPADGNTYWCRQGGVATNAFMGKAWTDWRAAGKDGHGTIADPGFVDPDNGDWSLKPGSPVLCTGFVPFDWRQAGVLKADSHWVAEAAKRTWTEFRDAPEPPICILRSARANFERFPVGPLLDTMSGCAPFRASPGKPGALSVTDRDVCSGRRALVFRDAADLPHSFQPHVFVDCTATDGVAHVQFLFKNVCGDAMSFEFRDVIIPDKVVTGGGIVCRHGKLLAEGKEVISVPDGVWTRVEIEIVLSGSRRGHWWVSVERPGAERNTVEFDHWRDPRFKCLKWLGFMTDGTVDAEWQLDDFELR